VTQSGERCESVLTNIARSQCDAEEGDLPLSLAEGYGYLSLCCSLHFTLLLPQKQWREASCTQVIRVFLTPRCSFACPLFAASFLSLVCFFITSLARRRPCAATMIRRLSSSVDLTVTPLPTSSCFCLAVSAGTIVLQLRSLKYSPYDGLRKRPSQSPAVQRRDAQIVFPKTLKSGRYENKSTISQKLFRGSSEATEENATPDTRFYRKAQDYREIQDPDPYSKLFGESKATTKTRLNAWQRQFEEENADVELPYERTNSLARSAPNWFVRFFINVRDGGGLDHMWHVVGLFLFVCMLLMTVSYLFYTAPSQAKPLSEIR
jgi:hypothetical protein